MDHAKKTELEIKLKQVLRDHQHEGLNMIGSADQLLHSLVDAVDEWLYAEPYSRQKTA